jgi:hypothetical protein
MIRPLVLGGSIIAVALAMGGCDAPAPVLPPAPPHGGTAFPLPDNKGFVEVLRQDVPGQDGQTQLVVYFIDADRKPLGAGASAASFQPKGKKAAKIALKPIEDPDPAKAGALSSAAFENPGDIAGTLSATIDGKIVSVAISVR